MPASATVISWYHQRDYQSLLAIFGDASSLPLTYKAWLEQATELERQVQRSGGRVIRAYLDPVEFPKWCKLHGKRVDASGRIAYGSEFAAETLSKESAGANKKTRSWEIPS